MTVGCASDDTATTTAAAALSTTTTAASTATTSTIPETTTTLTTTSTSTSTTSTITPDTTVPVAVPEDRGLPADDVDWIAVIRRSDQFGRIVDANGDTYANLVPNDPDAPREGAIRSTLINTEVGWLLFDQETIS